MRSISALPLAMFAATGMFLGASAVSGQETAADGVVRVTDAPAGQAASTSSGTVASNGIVEGNVGYGGECSDDCSDYGWCGLCQNGECVSPDHGWCRPIKYPVRRMPVQYYSYWPARWYGEPGSGIAPNAPRFPVIYTPTDTTQLGMYYQRVPQWLPNPAMIPPAPWPTDWHNRQCANGHGYGIGCSKYRTGGEYVGTTDSVDRAGYTTQPQPQRIETKTQQQPNAQPNVQPVPTPPAPIETDVQPPAAFNGGQAPSRVRF